MTTEILSLLSSPTILNIKFSLWNQHEIPQVYIEKNSGIRGEIRVFRSQGQVMLGLCYIPGLGTPWPVYHCYSHFLFEDPQNVQKFLINVRELGSDMNQIPGSRAVERSPAFASNGNDIF